MTWMRSGKSYSKVASRGGRWGGPKIHIAQYHKKSRGWEPICMPEPKYGFGMGYSTVSDKLTTTCKRCIKKGVDK